MPNIQRFRRRASPLVLGCFGMYHGLSEMLSDWFFSFGEFWRHVAGSLTTNKAESICGMLPSRRMLQCSVWQLPASTSSQDCQCVRFLPATPVLSQKPPLRKMDETLTSHVPPALDYVREHRFWPSLMGGPPHPEK